MFKLRSIYRRAAMASLALQVAFVAFLSTASLHAQDATSAGGQLTTAATTEMTADGLTVTKLLVAAFAIYVIFIVAKLIWKATGFAHK